MKGDRVQLLKYGFLFALLVAGWFALTMISKNIVAQIALGWVGFGVLFLFYRWVKKHKLPLEHTSQSESGEQTDRPLGL